MEVLIETDPAMGNAGGDPENRLAVRVLASLSAIALSPEW